MATITRAELADRALEAIGIKSAGNEASAEDANLAMAMVDTVHASLRKEGLAPYATSAFPEWAQSAMAHLVALELTATFGITGARMQQVASLAQKGRGDLATQMFGKRHRAPIKTDFF